MPGGLCTFGSIKWEYLDKEENDFIFHEIFLAKSYLKHGVCLRCGDTVVDVGANIGLFSLWCLSEAIDLRLIAVEPIPQIFEVLQRNLRPDATVGMQLALIKAAVGDQCSLENESTFTFFIDSPGESSRYPEEQVAQRTLLNAAAGRQSFIKKSEIRELGRTAKVKCPIVTLQQIFEVSGIHCVDLLKVGILNDNNVYKIFIQ
jgi:phthiocerol/phenolphthiocerol synthesis type-I polyketide synthase E